MKSAVLASALVAVSAAFADDSSLYESDVIYKNWFSEDSSADITEDNPVFLGSTVADTSNGYAVTAVVSVVIHAAVPTSGPTNITVNSSSIAPKGSICAAYDNNGTAKWYGLNNNAWVELKLASDNTTSFDVPTETDYTLVTEFDDTTTAAPKVRYWVGSQCSEWYTSGHASALTKVGLAGTGSYTKVVGLLVNAWTETIADVPISVDKTLLTAMCTALNISTSDTTPETIANALKTKQANNIEAWANYVLGITGTVAANKPFAAPVQNSETGKLTFKLGGVSPRTNVADVKYVVETLESPTATTASTSTDAVNADTETVIPLESSAVKYYRVKVQIDQAQEGN